MASILNKTGLSYSKNRDFTVYTPSSSLSVTLYHTDCSIDLLKKITTDCHANSLQYINK
jgi:hypothetical protein